ncbi:hypothetical protein [Antrihabitans sp. YC2-6]|uniref:hypothetical protein n=1 Tax=Antrihabitans sp. YC2-6 TaxID=2799498 RepID=UPI0018F703EB|nr:hypothetical protein [Antrihabitans sp. YC2-6]MBJ8343963.1 hypothetical protein [Antrihabitans sp. YC2-6]
MANPEYFLVKAHFIGGRHPDAWMLFKFEDGQYEIIGDGNAEWAQQIAAEYDLPDREHLGRK